MVHENNQCLLSRREMSGQCDHHQTTRNKMVSRNECPPTGRDWTLHAKCNGTVRYEAVDDTKKTFVHVDADAVPDLRIPVAHLINYSFIGL